MRSRRGGKRTGPALKLATRRVAFGESVDGVTRVEPLSSRILQRSRGSSFTTVAFRIAEFRWGVRGTVQRGRAATYRRSTKRFTFRSRRSAETQNSSLISADQRELDRFARDRWFGADTNAVPRCHSIGFA